MCSGVLLFFFFFQAEDGIRDWSVTGVQTCALPISLIRSPRPCSSTGIPRKPWLLRRKLRNSTPKTLNSSPASHISAKQQNGPLLQSRDIRSPFSSHLRRRQTHSYSSTHLNAPRTLDRGGPTTFPWPARDCTWRL